MPHAAPSLSVSVIARNEAKRLPEFLDGVAALEAEVVVLDTGSTDDTAALARAGGCTVHSFTWCDDFSAARNEALRHCSGRWILSLDADERIAASDFPALEALIAGEEDRCYRFTTRNYTDDYTTSGFVESSGDPNSAGFQGWFPSTKVRLFPNRPDIAFEGAVHELIGPSLERRGIAVLDTAIPIHHYPLLHRTAPEQRAKQEFYLALGKKKVAGNPHDAKAHHELGDQYLDLGEPGAALRAYREAVRIDPNNAHWLKSLGSALLLVGQLQPAIQALVLSSRIDPSSAECWRNLGVAYARAGQWPEAREAFQRSVGIDGTHTETCRYLALARHASGDHEGALALLEPFLRAHPAHGEGRELYIGIMETLGRKDEARRFLDGLGSRLS